MSPESARRCQGIVIGGSAGSVGIVFDLVAALPVDFPIPVCICLHLHANDDGLLASNVRSRSKLKVLEGCDKMPIQPGCIYVAPADYHLLIERTGTLALSVDPAVHYSRPSIDVLFESAGLAWGDGAVALLLSGANEDGVAGLRLIRSWGGLTVAQDPSTAQIRRMPQAAADAGAASLLLSPEGLRTLVLSLRG